MEPLSWVLAMFGVLVGGGGIWGMWKGKSEGAKIAQEALLAAQTFYQQTMEHQNTRIGALEARQQQLELGFQAEAYRAYRAELEAVKLYDWIAAGSPPPPPLRPTWAQHPVTQTPLSALTPSPPPLPPEPARKE